MAMKRLWSYSYLHISKAITAKEIPAKESAAAVVSICKECPDARISMAIKRVSMLGFYNPSVIARSVEPYYVGLFVPGDDRPCWHPLYLVGPSAIPSTKII
ncbi:hypothetical protein Dimus_034000 [Dionaea muscipula]